MNEPNFLARVQGLRDLESERATIAKVISDVGFCIIRGVFSPEQILKEFDAVSQSFDQSRDIRRSGPITYKMPNFQRLDCGDFAQVNARFARVITKFFWNADERFTSEFKVMLAVRDSLTGRKIAYENGCYELNGKKFYELPKIMQYPRGGGFINQHYDSYNNDGILNIGLSITRFGEHFKEGGLFYQYKTGEECPIEHFLEPGDLYIHDGPAVHGVHAVDPRSALELSELSGRVALILSSESFPVQ